MFTCNWWSKLIALQKVWGAKRICKEFSKTKSIVRRVIKIRAGLTRRNRLNGTSILDDRGTARTGRNIERVAEWKMLDLLAKVTEKLKLSQDSRSSIWRITKYDFWLQVFGCRNARAPAVWLWFCTTLLCSSRREGTIHTADTINSCSLRYVTLL